MRVDSLIPGLTNTLQGLSLSSMATSGSLGPTVGNLNPDTPGQHGPLTSLSPNVNPLVSSLDPLAFRHLNNLDLPQAGGLILSPALDPVPHRLVQRIQSRQFVELRELLADNMTLRQRYDAAIGFLPISLLPSAGPRYREISTLLQWVYCFNLYMAVRTSDPVTRDMFSLLTYSCLIMREAMCHEGSGWLQYDRTFRRQISIDPSLQWNTL